VNLHLVNKNKRNIKLYFKSLKFVPKIIYFVKYMFTKIIYFCKLMFTKICEKIVLVFCRLDSVLSVKERLYN